MQKKIRDLPFIEEAIMHNIKDFFHQIEHLTYEQRKPNHATLFANKALLSKLVWDIHSHNACIFYSKKNPHLKKSTLSEKGFLLGQLADEETELLQKIFNSCNEITLDANDFDSDYFYEPRINVHEHMERINHYYYPSDFLFSHLPKLIAPLIQTIEQECGFYWQVASMRIFKVKPVAHTQGMHKDDQPFAIKKIFFYPNGVSKELGSTQIEAKNGELVVMEGGPGTWLLFENSLANHQAFSSLTSPGRPTIEIDLMPAFETDPTLIYAGINSWHPWFPLDPRNQAINLNTPELNYDSVYERNLQRIAGLCTINRSDQYKYPVDLKDIETDESLFNEVTSVTHPPEVSLRYMLSAIPRLLLRKLKRVFI